VTEEFKPGPITGFKVSRMDPFETYKIEDLAAQLAGHLNNASNFQTDSETFAKRAQVERDKAAEMQKLITRVRERDRKRAAANK